MAQQRVTLGLQFTAPVSIKIDDADLDALLGALSTGEWYDVKVDDGTLRVNLSQIIYVKTDRDEPRIGFS